jgi:GNAT superfamily N-acetyltransferase
MKALPKVAERFWHYSVRALMERAEAWARIRGFRILALDVFALNTHAHSFYQHLGYVEETLKLIKEL